MSPIECVILVIKCVALLISLLLILVGIVALIIYRNDRKLWYEFHYGKPMPKATYEPYEKYGDLKDEMKMR